MASTEPIVETSALGWLERRPNRFDGLTPEHFTEERRLAYLAMREAYMSRGEQPIISPYRLTDPPQFGEDEIFSELSRLHDNRALLAAFRDGETQMAKGKNAGDIVTSLRGLGLNHSTTYSPAPEPLPEPTKTPTFPLDCLPPPYPEFCRAVSLELEVSTDIAACCCLAAMSTALSGVVVAHARTNWFEPVNLYCLGLSPTGERKTPIFRAFHPPIATIAKTLQTDWRHRAGQVGVLREIKKRELKAAIADGNTDEAQRLQTQLDELPDEPDAPMVDMADSTPDAICRAMRSNDDWTSLWNDECKKTFAHIDGSLYGGKAGGGANSEIYLRGYTGGPRYTVNRMGAPSFTIEQPTLSICLLGQPERLSELRSLSYAKSLGLLARFIYFFSAASDTPRTYNTPTTPPALSRHYHDAVVSLTQHRPPRGNRRHLVNFTPEAFAVIRSSTIALEHEPGPLTDWTNKLIGLHVRLAALIHCANDPLHCLSRPVGPATAEDAATICAYLVQTTRIAYRLATDFTTDTATADPDADARLLLQRLTDTAKTQFTRTDIHHIMKNKLTKAKQDDAIARLAERNLLRELSPEKRTHGNAPRIWALSA